MANLLFFNPLKYKNFNQFQIKGMQKCLENYGKYIQGKKTKILDVGCGDGYVTENIIYPFFKNGATEITATDISQPMIEWARKNNNNNLINYHVMDITKEPPKEYSGKFDLIVSAFCLMLVTQNQRTVNLNLYNMLQPNGEIFLVFAAYHPAFSIYKSLYQDNLLKHYMEKLNEFFPLYHDLDNKGKIEWYCDRLKSSGFKVNFCKIEKIPHLFSSIKNFRDSMDALNIFPIPNDLKEYYYKLYIEEAKRLGLVCEAGGKETVKIESKVFIIAAQKF